MSDMFVDPEDDPRGGAPTVGERACLTDYLRSYRLTLEIKCRDLSAEQMAMRSVPPSTMSLLGLLRHMVGVEHHWFRTVMAGSDVPRPYRSQEDRDLDFNRAVADEGLVEEAWAAWHAEVAFAEGIVERTESMDQRFTMPNGDDLELRDLLVHMIEEYARHCGHADLLRECVDGRTGQ